LVKALRKFSNCKLIIQLLYHESDVQNPSICLTFLKRSGFRKGEKWKNFSQKSRIFSMSLWQSYSKNIEMASPPPFENAQVELIIFPIGSCLAAGAWRSGSTLKFQK
jgi:hypothetical protein